MKQSSKKKALALAAVLCAGLVGGGVKLSAPVYAEETNTESTETVAVEQTYNVVDFPYNTWYSEFGYYNAGNVEYVLKAGLFDATAADYGLKAFDTKVDDNAVSHSAISGLEARNWKWSYADNSSVVVEVKSKISGKIKFDFGATSGWMDCWNTIFSVHRKNADGTLDTLVDYFQANDKVSGTNLGQGDITDYSFFEQTVNVAVGDVVYYEIGSLAGGGRNLQGVANSKVIATPIADNPVLNKISELMPSWTAAYKELNEKHYTAENWATVQDVYASFAREGKNCADEAAVQALYDAKLVALKAVATDPVLVEKEVKATALKTFYESKAEGDFTTENWTVYKGAYDEFVAGLDACTTVDAVNELYAAKLAAMQSVKAFKQSGHYLDYPSKMNANGYTWITGDVFDTKLYAGTVADKKEFDTQGSSENIMYSAALNEGLDNPAYYAENWKWYVGRDAGVIVAFKANQDMKLTITNTRVADGNGQGWTSDCKLSYYIERDGRVKNIYEVNAPSADEQFTGDWYLKTGDILYVEFVSSIINAGEVRNTEAPCNTAYTADATQFDAEKYAEQNHDLPAEVVDAINAKLALLQEYAMTLKEEDYSATNWLTLQDLAQQFMEKSEKEVETIADVEALYETTLAAMKAVPNKAQAAAELKAALDGYAAELQAEYDKLTKENKYTDENKAKLDKALTDGKAAIAAAKSKSAGNTAKLNAVAALRAVEKKAADEGGCGSFVGTVGGVAAALTMVGAAVIVRKKED